MKRIGILLLVCLAFPLSARGNEPSLTLQNALEIARSGAPEGVMARHDTAITQAERLKANRYPNPEIAIGVGPNFETLGGNVSNTNLFVGGDISQEVVLWGKRRLRKEIADQSISISKIQELITSQDIDFQVRILYAGILRSQERLALTRHNIQIAQRFVGGTHLKYQQNEVPYADVVRAKLELAKQHKNLIQEKKDLKVLKERLNLLLARDLNTPFRAGDPFRPLGSLPPLDTLITKSQERPEFQSIQVQQEQNEKEIRLAKQEAKPNLILGLFAEKDDPDRSFGPTSGIELPIAYRNKGEIETAKAKRMKTNYQKEYLSKKIELQVRNNYLELQRTMESLKMQKEMIESTGDLFRTTFQAYLEGKAEFLRFLETLETINNLKAEYFDTLFEYFAKKANLERAIGGELVSK